MARILSRISPSRPPSSFCVSSACSTNSGVSVGMDPGVLAFSLEQQFTDSLLGHRDVS